jgi:hypothetical protein
VQWRIEGRYKRDIKLAGGREIGVKHVMLYSFDLINEYNSVINQPTKPYRLAFAL